MLCAQPKIHEENETVRPLVDSINRSAYKLTRLLAMNTENYLYSSLLDDVVLYELNTLFIIQCSIMRTCLYVDNKGIFINVKYPFTVLETIFYNLINFDKSTMIYNQTTQKQLTTKETMSSIVKNFCALFLFLLSRTKCLYCFPYVI